VVLKLLLLPEVVDWLLVCPAHHKSVNSEEKSVLVANMQGLKENLIEQ